MTAGEIAGLAFIALCAVGLIVGRLGGWHPDNYVEDDD